MGTLRNIIVEFRTLDSDTFTSREYDVDEGTTDGVVTLDKLQKGTAYHLRIYSGNEQFRGGYVTVFVNTSTTGKAKLGLTAFILQSACIAIKRC